MENIIGSVAMVRDRIDEYLSLMRIGVVSSVDDNSLFAQLTFSDLSQARFASKEIYVLKDKAELYTQLLSGAAKVSLTDFKLLFQVNMLQDRGDASSLIQACQLLKSSPTSIFLATDKLSTRLEMNLSSQQQSSHSR
ncbi:hypothetical protein QWY86_05795 [Pedobacter aquatilis]|uniref:hypothetical protein n=1 Tax=Pedobacter aquatilis TaxID=351343 RepID=UPI0025B600CE|nr:hypothetical protein [Pedobacter aquatilis]MDN3586169.1 hypothetical protein [Pedobacter aquatilis]